MPKWLPRDWLPWTKPKSASPVVGNHLLERCEDSLNPAYASLADLLGQSLPEETYNQYNSRKLMDALVPTDGEPSVLDIGCGRGRSRDWFVERNPNVAWRGIEVSDSYNVDSKTAEREDIEIYDGRSIPYPDASFDFCFSHQVFEHVRHPVDLLQSVHDVLRDEGVFFGSLSGGEPYHFHSLFNYTALGWKTVLEDNGFELVNLYAGIDTISLTLHHWSKNRDEMGPYFKLSILNELLAREEPKSAEAIRYQNALKLAFAGHLVFEARKA